LHSLTALVLVTRIPDICVTRRDMMLVDDSFDLECVGHFKGNQLIL